MTTRLMGMETEYALVWPSSEVAGTDRLMSLARRKLVHLPDRHSAGMFTASGARFMIDLGHHPEWATPETDDPTELVRYACAGDQTLRDLVQELAGSIKRPGPYPPLLVKSNLDYCQMTSWAAHESYLVRGRVEGMPRQLIPHLVSRVYLGSGGLNPLCPGVQFSMTPRLHLFSEVVSESTTNHQRGIYNTRDESLCGGDWRRIHVICGESLCSQAALWLKTASTALVVAMAEAKLNPGGAVQVARPIAAMHAFATDVHFRAAADIVGSAPMTAIEIQRHYLRCAEAHVDHPLMPAWAATACRRWREALDEVERGPDAAIQTFDWAVKRKLFDQLIRRRGFDPQKFDAWNHALTCVRDVHRTITESWRFDASALFGSNPAIEQERRNLQTFLRHHGLDWEEARDVLKLRAQLCEIDVRYAQLTPTGLHAQLSASLRHVIVESAAIREARHQPPPRTRSRLRGRMVRELAARGQVAASWDGIWNFSDGRAMYLSDPFAIEADWRPFAHEPDEQADPISQCVSFYEGGDYPRAYLCATRAGGWLNELASIPAMVRQRLLRVTAWTRARAGERQRALAMLDRLSNDLRPARLPAWLIADYAGVHRKCGLKPDNVFWDWIERGEEALAAEPQSASAPVLLGHKGFGLNRMGESARAVEVLRQACGGLHANQSRIHARNLADLADAHFGAGDTVAANAILCEAKRIQLELGFYYDLADHTTIVQAKMAPSRAAAMKLLRKAERLQIRSGNRVALVRTLLMQGRLCVRRRIAARIYDRIVEMRDRTEALTACPVLAKFILRWREWTSPERAFPVAANSADYFDGL